MSQRLADTTALVTGASSGIGRAIALRFDKEDASVAVADVRSDPREGGTPTHELLSDGVFIETDVSDIEQLRSTIDETVETFGSLDVMVNNAGVFPGPQPVETVSEDEYDRLLAINLKGVYFGCTLAAEIMREQGDGGSIINLSSIAGVVAFDDSAAYCASKGGVTNLTRELAVELGDDGIRVNAINPGVIETAMSTEDAAVAGTLGDRIPLGRDGQPEEIAGVALFLASEESAYVTGHNLVVDGGYTAR
ncbi:MAG: SDR family oxidoreductase [Euryarchaeota archaeon]|nr:SDR family oxidoreductase [Euryarchaeota archaeon]